MHPDGFHKDDEAKARCWGCSHPEKLVWSVEDEALAQRLIAEGWLSTSNRYCHIARACLPPAEVALTLATGLPEWLAEEMRREYKKWTRRGLRVHGDREGSGIESMTLTPAQYRAFRHLGGQSA